MSGPPSLSREQIRSLAPCPVCKRAIGQPCINRKARNHHERMRAAQREWSVQNDDPVLIEDDLP